MKKIDEIRNYLIEEIGQNKLIFKKHKKVCRVLNYANHSLIVISTKTRCVFIFAFAALVIIAVRIASSTIGLKICVITARIKNHKSMIKKKMKKHDKSVFLAKPKLLNL